MTAVGRMTAAAVIVAGSIMLGGTAHAAVAARQAAPVQLAVREAESGQITSPSDGQVITSGSVPISAHTGMMQLSMALYVEGPSTPRQKVASGGANQTLSGTFDAGSAPNGTFTVTLKGEITGTTYSTSTFKLKRPATAPSGVNAALQGKNKIVVTWSKGSEPDLQSYEVSTTQSGIVGRLGTDSACSGSTCKATLAVPAKAEGQKVGFTVKAYRGDGDGGSIASSSSSPAYVTIPAAVQPKKTKSPTNQQSPKTTTQNLPTLPNGKKQTLPTVIPTHRAVPKNSNKLPAMPNTDPKGNFPLPTATEGTNDGLTPDTSKTGTTPADSQVKAQSSESPMGNIGQYGLYVAGGLLLLLLAAHGGAWARRRALAANGGGAAAAAPSVAVPPAGDGPRFAESVPPTTTAPRRPAVVLAVAKTRTTDTGSSDAQGDQAKDEARTKVPEQARVEPAALARYLSTDDVSEGRPEPVRIALPSSAVTVMPEGSVTPPAVRIEDRWDDYLPPSPRAMEDSGFWERPAPGDFWAADEDPAYARRAEES
ncbi:hypothetical protein ACIBHX_36580 [Nonomuraea sp. NPDC050536]|uniref:hypothetical protein n=1 Tax=Nonomuraea sp. NPDC050536 TaxID=3364366 RepID=UPI0037C6314B